MSNCGRAGSNPVGCTDSSNGESKLFIGRSTTLAGGAVRDWGLQTRESCANSIVHLMSVGLRFLRPQKTEYALLAKLVYARDLGSRSFGSVGSSPMRGTDARKHPSKLKRCDAHGMSFL